MKILFFPFRIVVGFIAVLLALPAFAQYTDPAAVNDLGGPQEFARRRAELAKQLKTGYLIPVRSWFWMSVPEMRCSSSLRRFPESNRYTDPTFSPSQQSRGRRSDSPRSFPLAYWTACWRTLWEAGPTCGCD